MRFDWSSFFFFALLVCFFQCFHIFWLDLDWFAHIDRRYWVLEIVCWRDEATLDGQMAPHHFWHWLSIRKSLLFLKTPIQIKNTKKINWKWGGTENVFYVCAFWRDQRGRPEGLTRFGSIVHTQPQAGLSRIHNGQHFFYETQFYFSFYLIFFFFFSFWNRGRGKTGPFFSCLNGVCVCETRSFFFRFAPAGFRWQAIRFLVTLGLSLLPSTATGDSSNI